MGWVDRCKPTTLPSHRGVLSWGQQIEWTSDLVLWGILGGVLKNGYKLGRRKGGETLFHTESIARVCKGVGISRELGLQDGVE